MPANNITETLLTGFAGTALLTASDAVILTAFAGMGVTASIGAGFTAATMTLATLATVFFDTVLPQRLLDNQGFQMFKFYVIAIGSSTIAAALMAVIGCPISLPQAAMITLFNLTLLSLAMILVSSVGACYLCGAT